MKKKIAVSASPKSFSGGGHASFLDFPEGKVVVNDAKVTEAVRRDGLRPVAARGNDRLPPEALLSQCRQLRMIERRFRANKHDMRIRPVYRWKPRRMLAPVAIGRAAFCCVRRLHRRQSKLGRPTSRRKIRREIDVLQAAVALHPETSRTCRLPSPASADALCICRRWASPGTTRLSRSRKERI